MALSLTTKEANDLWVVEGAGQRRAIAKRTAYYNGQHAILRRAEWYADGKAKTNRVVNWPRAIVDAYVGLLTGQPFSVSSTEADDDIDGTPIVQAYREAEFANALTSLDVKLLRTALSAGFAVETHEFDANTKRPVIRFADPSEWCFIKDAYGKNIIAIRQMTLKRGTVYTGDILDKDSTVMSIYDDASIMDYIRSADGVDWTPTQEPVAHNFKRIPVVVWRTDDDHAGLISDTMINLCDEFNEIFSTAGDEVRREVDALLKITNCSADWLMANATKIKEQRILPLGENSDAEYIGRQINTTPAVEHLARVREAIHVAASVPDVASIMGATGETSGIALQLKFMPMLQSAASMAHMIRAALQERIALIDTRAAQVNGGTAGAGVNINISITLPTNRIEEWQNIKNLDGVVSHRKQLEMLTDVSDPDSELERIAAEGRARSMDSETPEQAAQKQLDRLAVNTEGMMPQAGELVKLLTTVVRDEALRSGVIDRAVNNAIKAE